MTVVRQGLFFQLESSNQRHLPHAVQFPSLPTIVKNILIGEKKKKKVLPNHHSSPPCKQNVNFTQGSTPHERQIAQVCVHSDHSLFTLPVTRLKVEDWGVVQFWPITL